MKSQLLLIIICIQLGPISSTSEMNIIDNSVLDGGEIQPEHLYPTELRSITDLTLNNDDDTLEGRTGIKRKNSQSTNLRSPVHAKTRTKAGSITPKPPLPLSVKPPYNPLRVAHHDKINPIHVGPIASRPSIIEKAINPGLLTTLPPPTTSSFSTINTITNKDSNNKIIPTPDRTKSLVLVGTKGSAGGAIKGGPVKSKSPVTGVKGVKSSAIGTGVEVGPKTKEKVKKVATLKPIYKITTTTEKPTTTKKLTTTCPPKVYRKKFLYYYKRNPQVKGPAHGYQYNIHGQGVEGFGTGTDPVHYHHKGQVGGHKVRVDMRVSRPLVDKLLEFKSLLLHKLFGPLNLRVEHGYYDGCSWPYPC